MLHLQGVGRLSHGYLVEVSFSRCRFRYIRKDADGSDISRRCGAALMTNSDEQISFAGKFWPSDTERLDVSSLGPNRFESDISPVSDLTLLAGFTNLKSLNLRGTQINDLTPLAKLVSIEGLQLGSTEIADLSPLRNLSKLQILDLQNTNVTDIGALAVMPNLKQLFLHECDIYDLTPLSTAKNLEWLVVEGTKVENLEPLRNLVKLETLNASQTPVHDLRPLRKLRSLKSLNLSNTGVTQVKCISELKSLEHLYLDDTVVMDLSLLLKLPNLQSLTYHGIEYKNSDDTRAFLTQQKKPWAAIRLFRTLVSLLRAKVDAIHQIFDDHPARVTLWASLIGVFFAALLVLVGILAL